jgi:hypothetical protein
MGKGKEEKTRKGEDGKTGIERYVETGHGLSQE